MRFQLNVLVDKGPSEELITTAIMTLAENADVEVADLDHECPDHTAVGFLFDSSEELAQFEDDVWDQCGDSDSIQIQYDFVPDSEEDMHFLDVFMFQTGLLDGDEDEEILDA